MPSSLSVEKLSGVLHQLKQQHSLTDSDLRKAVQWMLAPTVRPVVGIREFIESPEYLNAKHSVWPLVMVELEEMNSGRYSEVVLTGGIGSAKTTSALYSTAYQLYKLSCYANPHQLYGLDSASEIVFIFQSLNATTAKDVEYERFRSMIERSPYFTKHFRFDKDLQSELVFPNRIIVRPVSGKETAAIGQNVFGGIIDEVNFMSVISKSRASVDGGVYDQAVQLYNSIARRRKSRFLSGGTMPGLLCLVSSKRYPGQFTDKKSEEAKTNPQIYVYDKRVWDVKPEAYTGEFFPIFIGDHARKPRIIEEGEVIRDSERELIDHIPIEYMQEFRDDIIKALRDIAGHSSLAIHPYFQEREKVDRAFGRAVNIFKSPRVDFVEERPRVSVSSFVRLERKRFVHLDLGLSSDSAGLVIGHVYRFARMQRADHVELMPCFYIDGVLEIAPPRNGEIRFESIRTVLYKLVELGLRIKWVTADTYQSVDTLQILKQRGFMTSHQSMDTSMLPYDVLKSAIYDGRVEIPQHPKLFREVVTLERDFKKGKVDHPQRGSKDLSDALAGVVYGLTMRMETWAEFGIHPNQAQSLRSLKVKSDA